MQKITYYEKIGRKYLPVKEYQNYDGLQKGHWLLNVQPGSTSYRYKLDTEAEYPNLIAAIEEYKDILIEKMRKAGELRPRSIQMSKKETKAWEKYKEIMGKDIPSYFEYESLQGIVDEWVKKITEILLEKRNKKL
jgi:hypothetical protein